MENTNIRLVKELIENKESFVLNIVAAWCPDCTERQAPNLLGFKKQLDEIGLSLYNLEVQKERRVYLNSELEDFVVGLGGHGFPRTVLFVDGTAKDTDNVEVLTAEQLSVLVTQFKQQL